MTATGTSAAEFLPRDRAQFIAYSQARTRRANGDTRQTGRAEVFVKFYPQLKISEYREGGRHGAGPAADGFATDLVTFDGRDIGLTEPFGASLLVGDPVIEPLRAMLREAHANGTPVTDILIETGRKKKRSDTKKAIPAWIGISTLRGVPGPEGSESKDGEAKKTVTNTLAVVGAHFTAEVKTDPTEWAILADNKDGTLPPDGWTHIVNPDAGESYIIADPTTTAATPTTPAPREATNQPRPDQQTQPGAHAPEMDPTQLRNFLEVTIRGAIAEALDKQRGRKTNKQGFDEGLPYEPRANNGMVNLGSYVVTADGACYRWAADLLGGDAHPQDIDRLTDRVMTMADMVQAGAYGHGIESNRSKNSHCEARRWVQWLIASDREGFTYPDGDAASNEDVSAWRDRVVAEASRLLGRSGERTGAYLQARFAPPSQRATQTAQKDQAQPATAADAATATTAEDSDAQGVTAGRVRAALNAIRKNWDNPRQLTGIAEHARSIGLDAVKVGVAEAGDGPVPAFAYPPGDPARAWTLMAIIERRLSQLVGPGGDAREQPPAGHAGHDREAPEAREGREGREASALSVLVDALNAAAALADVERVYFTARENDLLSASVWQIPSNGRAQFAPDPARGGDQFLLMDAISRVAEMWPDTASDAGQNGSANRPDAQPSAQPGQERPVPDAATRAQQIADRAMGASSLEDLHALRQQAITESVLEETVEVGGTRGMLRTLIAWREDEVSGRLAPAS